jgi:pyridoxine kinase
MYAPVQRVAAIHDLSGFGRTSLTVVIPVLSALGIQVCPLPTAVLSTQTSGFDDFCFVDLSAAMRSFLAHWRTLGLRFDAVYSGFLGSPRQVETVAECIAHCLASGGITVVDPVLGDNGSLDPTMTPEMVDSMRHLVSKAYCITPNLTEAAFLLNEDYPGADLDTHGQRDWLRRLAALGPEYVVITSAPLPGEKHKSAVVAYERTQKRYWQVKCDYLPAFYPGTGDTFASVLTGCLLLGDSLPMAMDRAVQFVTLGIRATFGHTLSCRDGILLERILQTLQIPLCSSTYTLFDAS